MSVVVMQRIGSGQHGRGDGQDCGNRNEGPEPTGGDQRTASEVSLGLEYEVQSAVERERQQSHYTTDDRIPVQNARIWTGAPVGPQREKKVAVRT